MRTLGAASREAREEPGGSVGLIRRRATAPHEGSEPVERLALRTPTLFRRRLIGGAMIAVLIFTGVSAALAWRQYRDDKHRAISDLNARVVLVGGVVNSYLAGGVSTLGAMSEAPSVVRMKPALMASYFHRVARSGGTIFSGGIGWADRSGEVVASSSGGKPVSVADRVYFKTVSASGKPYISAGLIGRKLRQPIIVVAVPTRDAAGRLTGVLSGAIGLKTLGQSKQNSALGFEGLTIADRDGHLLLAGLARTTNPAMLARIQQLGQGDFTNAEGLSGGSHHVLAFATASLPGWSVVIDRPASSVYASARRSLELEIVSLGAALFAVLLILFALVKRSRREIEAQGEQAQSWSKFTRTLALASTPADVADVVLESVQSVFPDAVVVVTLESEAGQETRATSRLPGWRRVAGDSIWLRTIAGLTADGPATRSLERERPLRDLYLAFGRRLKALHTYPVSGRAQGSVGGIALLTERTRLVKSEWELLGAFAAQAGQSLERARAFEHEHELAVRLQQSLLPADLPSSQGLNLAGVYLAGGDGIAVGGDWYDALLRPDGILQLCVGDVSGRGVGAATVMGRMRGTFRAYAYDLISPAEILRRMLRHVNEDEMITAVCVSIDPVEGLISYSSAGHPPSLSARRRRGSRDPAGGRERAAARRGRARRHDREDAAATRPCPARDVHRRARRAPRREHRRRNRCSREDDARRHGAHGPGSDDGDQQGDRRPERRCRVAARSGRAGALVRDRAAGGPGEPARRSTPPEGMARSRGIRKRGRRRRSSSP